jgi:hypothetical protein
MTRMRIYRSFQTCHCRLLLDAQCYRYIETGYAGAVASLRAFRNEREPADDSATGGDVGQIRTSKPQEGTWP